MNRRSFKNVNREIDTNQILKQSTLGNKLKILELGKDNL